ncbi:hypothetical protein LguiA_030441 [Lonicera macranthoides]
MDSAKGVANDACNKAADAGKATQNAASNAAKVTQEKAASVAKAAQPKEPTLLQQTGDQVGNMAQGAMGMAQGAVDGVKNTLGIKK